MNRCTRARELFGPYWDDETTRAERDWLEAHFAACPSCREAYEALARTLSAVATLPRHEAAPDLAERALAAAKHAAPAADRVFADPRPRWQPVAAAAAVIAIAIASLVAWQGGRSSQVAVRTLAGAERRLVALGQPRSLSHAQPAERGASPRAAAGTAISDSLFDHSEDVDFVLDPVTLRRGRAHTASRLSHGIQGDQAVITF